MRAHTVGWGIVGAAVWLLTATPRVCLAAPTDPAMARQLLKEGYDLSSTGKCAEAVVVLQRSIDLDPQPKAYLNRARCDEELGRYGDALKHWVLARDLARDQQLRSVMSEAESRLASIEARMPYVTLKLGTTPAQSLTLRRDGARLPVEAIGRPLPVDPGKHVIVVEAPGHAERTLAFEVVERSRVELVVEPGEALAKAESPAVALAPPMPTLKLVDTRPAPAKSSAATPLIWGGLGLAFAGAVTGTVTGIATLSKSDVRERCAGGCLPEDMAEVERARTTGTVSTIAFAAAGVGLATAGVGLYLRSRTTRMGDTTVTPTLGGMSARWAF